jgi:hypothetical protein
LPNDFRTSRICTDDIVSPSFFCLVAPQMGGALLSFSTLMPEAEFVRHHHPQFRGF